MSVRQDGTTARDEVLSRRMKGRRPAGSWTLVTVGTFVLILGVLAGGILGHLAVPAAGASTSSEHLYLTIAFSPYTGLDEYFPANFTVAENIPVTITITNYDNGTNAVPAAFSQVVGTVGGTETVTNATASEVAVSSVPVTQIAHTFTLVTGPYNINVPVPAAQATTPTVVTFTVIFTSAGQFEWHCMAPCDGHSMATAGYMTGTVTVVSA